MSNSRHSLNTLKQIACWINTNDTNNRQSNAWEVLHKKMIGLPEGSYLDISGIKADSKGSKVTKEYNSAYSKHGSLPLVWEKEESFSIYRKCTGLE